MVVRNKLTVDFAYYIPMVGNVRVVAKAADVNAYEADDLTFQFYSIDGEPVDVLYNPEMFEVLEDMAVGFLSEEKHHPEVNFTK